jgi:hypothetical protein
MQWLNGASFGDGERSAIVSYLSETRAASTWRISLEWAAILVGLATLSAIARRFLGK